MKRSGRTFIKICLMVLTICFSLIGFLACDKQETTQKSKFRLDRTAYIMRVDEEVQLNVITKEANFDVAWSCEDQNIATVSENGLVQAVSTGTTTVFAVVNGETLTCALTIKDKDVFLFFTSENELVERVNLSKTTAGDYPTSKKIDVEVEVNYKTLDEEVTWTSSDDAIATVLDGTVSAVKKGDVVITASIVIDGQTYMNAFYVSVHPEYVKIEKDVSFFTADDVRSGVAFEYEQNDSIDYVELSGERLNTTDYKVSAATSELIVNQKYLVAKGRYDVTVSEEIDEDHSYLYKYPFVYADYVIRTIDDLNAMESQRMNMGEEYYVLANDLDFEGGEFVSSPQNITQGTFDGYGHFISNLTIADSGDGTRRWGLFGNAASFGAAIKDLAIINVSTNSPYGVVLGGTFTNAIVENVFVMGKNVEKEINSMLVGTIAGTTQIHNCVVIDNGNLGGKNKSALGRLSGDTNAVSIENVIAVTDGYAIGTSGENVDNTDDWAGITKVGPSSATYDEDLFSAFAKMDGVGPWTFDKDAKTLFLWGRSVYTMPTTVEAQFIEKADSLTLDTVKYGNVKSLRIDDESVLFESSNQGITFTYDIVGRHNAVIQTENESYRIPFVLADKVIRSKDDFTGSGKNMGISSNNSTEYIVLATDLDYTGDTTEYKGGRSQFKGTFDGYGHKIINIHVAQYSATAQYAGLLATSSLGAVVKDLALVDATFHSQKGGLFGAAVRSYGTFENVFISATVIDGVTENNSLLLPYMHQSKDIVLKNCVIINKSPLRIPVGISYDDTLTKISVMNTLFVGEGNAFLGKSGKAITVSGITQVLPSSITYSQDLIKALKMLDRKGNWTFKNNTLSLKGNAVYTVVTE